MNAVQMRNAQGPAFLQAFSVPSIAPASTPAAAVTVTVPMAVSDNAALLYNSPTCPEAVLSCVYTDARCRRAEGCDNGRGSVWLTAVRERLLSKELMPPANG